MKKEVNIVLIAYLIINITIVVLSACLCVQFVPKGYNGLPFAEFPDGTIGWISLSDGEVIGLPAPSSASIIYLTILPAIICTLSFMCKKKWLGIVGIILEILRILCLIFSVKIINFVHDKFSLIGCYIGSVFGDYEFTLYGWITVFLCVVSLVIYIMRVKQFSIESQG